MARHRQRHLCRACHQRKALFCIEGRWKADRLHDLCTRCYRSIRDRLSSVQLKLLSTDGVQSASSEQPLA